jgi:hypothetical protein
VSLVFCFTVRFLLTRIFVPFSLPDGRDEGLGGRASDGQNDVLLGWEELGDQVSDETRSTTYEVRRNRRDPISLFFVTAFSSSQ